MPVGTGSLLHSNSGGASASGTSVVVSLKAGDSTSDGSTVIVLIRSGASVSVLPTGFETDHSVSVGPVFFHKPNVAAGETSWTFTLGSAVPYTWAVLEYADLDLSTPYEAAADGSLVFPTTNGGSVGTGTPAPLSMNTIAIAAWGVTAQTSTDTPGSWSSYTNSFTQVEQVTSTVASATNNTLAVAHREFTTSGSVVGSAATWVAGSGSNSGQADVALYRAADSPIITPLAWHCGFEQGTHNGLLSQLNGTYALFGGGSTGTVGTDFIVQASSARNSGYGCRIVQSAAAKYLTAGPGGYRSFAMGWDLRVASSTGVVALAEFIPVSGTTTLQVVYDTSNSKVGVRWGSGGTASYQSGTTAANTWVWIDLKVSFAGSAFHVDWTLETGASTYTAQTSPADLTGQTSTTLSGFRLGSSTAQTVTQDIDNLVFAAAPGYPVGPHVVYARKVDPAGTPTVNGTVGNFALVTNNATGSTLTSGTLTSARDAIDELPPTISASSDGLVQTTTAATDYLQFPMDTYTCGPTEVINGVRVLACMISTTGAGSGTLEVRGWDGAVEKSLMVTGSTTPGSSTTVGNTVPPWLAGQWASANGWTQAELDAAAVRVGYSNDATPDMGVHAVYLEIAVGKTRSQQLFGSLASVEQDPNRGGAVSVTVSAPAGQNASLYYEESGSPTTVPVSAGSTATEQINATFAEDTNYVALYPDPEGVADA